MPEFPLQRRCFSNGSASPALQEFVLLVGCSSSEAEQLDSRGWPRTLKLCYVPPDEEPERIARQELFRGLEEYLGKKLNLKVTSVQSGAYIASIEAMRAGKIDICEFGAFSYVLAHKIANAQPIIVRGTGEENQTTYRSVIITGASSGIESLEQAIAESQRLTLSFTDPASTSGHLVPRGHLDSLGVKPEEAFKNVVFTMGHTASVLTAIEGKVDVAAVADAALGNMSEKGLIQEGDYRVLWSSPPMPGGPIAIRGDLPEDFRQAVQQAYLTMKADDPELWSLVTSQYHTRNTVYLPADDSMYDYYRTIARGVEDMNLLD